MDKVDYMIPLNGKELAHLVNALEHYKKKMVNANKEFLQIIEERQKNHQCGCCCDCTSEDPKFYDVAAIDKLKTKLRQMGTHLPLPEQPKNRQYSYE